MSGECAPRRHSRNGRRARQNGRHSFASALAGHDASAARAPMDSPSTGAPLKVHPTALCTVAPAIAWRAFHVWCAGHLDREWLSAEIHRWGQSGPVDWGYGSLLRLRGRAHCMCRSAPKPDPATRLLSFLLILRTLLVDNLLGFTDACSRELLCRTQGRLWKMQCHVLGGCSLEDVAAPSLHAGAQHVVHRLCDRVERGVYGQLGVVLPCAPAGEHGSSTAAVQEPHSLGESEILLSAFPPTTPFSGRLEAPCWEDHGGSVSAFRPSSPGRTHVPPSAPTGARRRGPGPLAPPRAR